MADFSSDFEETAFWTRAAQGRLEAIQRRARTTFGAEKTRTEMLTRRDLREWARKNSEDGNLKASASLSEADSIVNGRMGELLGRVQGGGRWPPDTGGARPPPGIGGFAADAVGAVDEWRHRVGVAEGTPDGDEYLHSLDAKAVYEDHRRNPVGVRERESRQLTESASRWRASGSSLSDVDASLDAWRVNPNIFELSTDAHVIAYGRNYLGRIADDLGAEKFVGLVGDQAAGELDVEGRTAQVLYRVFDEEGLDSMFRAINEGRRTFSSWRTLGLGHGTREVFWPIVPGQEDEAAAYYAKERSDFLGTFAGTRRKTAVGIGKDIRAMREKIAADLAEGSDLAPDAQRRLLERLSALLDDLRNGRV